jgi:hypothetical protein
VVLVDRYIPGGDSLPWASEWTTTYFEFLKPLSRTHLLTDGEINGSAYGFTPEYQANLPSSLSLGAAWPETVKVKVAKGQTGLISWLERAHSETHAGQYCPQVSNQIQVWMRRHKVIAAFEDLEIELDCRLWLHNSVVLQNATLEGISNAQKRLFNYADLDNVLEDCWGQFNISECKVLTALDVTLMSNYSYAATYPDYDNISFLHQLFYSSPLFQIVPSQYYFAVLLYAVPPKRENKPLFTEEVQRTNLGKPVVLIASVAEDPEPEEIPLTLNISLTYLNLKALWPDNAVQVSWGLDLYQASPTPVLTVPLQNNIASGGIAATLQTQTNNHNPSSLMTRQTPIWGSGRYKTVAELAGRSANTGVCVWVQETNCFYKSSNIVPDDSLLNGLDVIPQSVVNRWWYRAEHTASLPFGQTQSLSSTLVYGANTSQVAGRIFQFDLEVSFPLTLSGGSYSFYRANDLVYLPENFTSEQPAGLTRDQARIISRPIGSGYEAGRYSLELINEYFIGPAPFSGGEVLSIDQQYRYRFSGQFVSIQFAGSDELELFDNFPVALFRHDLEHTNYRYLKEIPRGESLGLDSWVLPDGLSHEVNNYYEVINQMIVNAQWPSNFTHDRTTIISLPGSNNSQSKYTETGPLPNAEFYLPRPALTGIIGSTQRLNRTLRVQPITKPLYVIQQGQEVSFPTESQMLLLIEPTPGFFLCDPNPDPLQNRNTDPQPNNPNNTEWIGDIMPDSLRVKEIHAALQADKYANDDFDAQKARVANLGWLIDKMSNVLGLHFASDGEMLKVRATEHKKDGDTIPEQWQIGQWGKNNWIAKKSTGQNVAVNGVGYAYEVRSNGFTTDKFTGQPTAIEEGGWVLCNSLIQLLETKFDDDDRAFGLQNAGANVIPRSDRTGYLSYEGMHGLLVEIAYMLSSMSGNITRSEVLNMKSVAILQEILGAQGLPVTLKTIPAKIAGQDMSIPYPGFEAGSPSLVDFFFWILSNLGPLVASQLVVPDPEEKNTGV